MTYRRGVTALALALTLGLSACDPGSLVLPLLTVSMTWSVEGDPDRSFSFQSEDDGQISGTLDESTENRGGESAPLSGGWVEGVLTFTVQWPQPVTWRAEFEEDNPTSLIIVSDDETLTITQG
jgi:hypothetical protein